MTISVPTEKGKKKMREILFRGQDIRGVWHIGLIAHIGNAWYISNKAGIATAYEVIPATIGEYTGLTDKNGKRIFEGDILSVMVNEVEESDGLIELGLSDKKTKVPTGNKIETVWSVEWKNFSGYTGFRAYGKDRRFNIPLTYNAIFNAAAEVIGNIHDNPELIGERKDNG